MVQHALSRSLRPLRAWLSPAPALLLAGCFQDVRQSTVFPESDTTRVVQDVYRLVTWIDTVIFIFVFVLLAWVVIRYRERKGQALSIPKQVHGSTGLEIAWTIIPALILVFIAVPTWEAIFRNANPPPTNTMTIRSIGHQWWWEFNYNELGLITANELHIPLGKSIVIDTQSKDVIHSFWVPKLVGKQDAIPGKTNVMWFTPEKTGIYYGQCAEFCGTSHANMRFRVIVDTQADFDAWVARTKQPQKAETAEAKDGEGLFAAKGCIACHTITGRPDAVGQLGPNLTNLHDRGTIASALIDNSPENLQRWVQHPELMKPGVKMILPVPVNPEEAKKLQAYLMSPTGTGAPATAAGKPAQAAAMTGPAAGGAPSYAAIVQSHNCWVCHTIPDVANAKGTIGPNMAGLMSRPKMVGGLLDTNEANLRKWLANPQAVKPTTLMVLVPPLTPAEVDVAVKHLISTYK